MLPELIRYYVLTALEGAPDVVDGLTLGLTDAEADFKPDPERFTIREIVAHLAEWDAVFRERLELSRDQDSPELPRYDPSQLAIDHNYAGLDWRESLRLFRERRKDLAALVKSLPADMWDRTALHSHAGPVSVQEQVVMIVGHDGYHFQQLAQWRTGAAKTT